MNQLKTKTLSSEDKSNINILRKKVSGIYNTHSKNNPSISYSSDGTGTGKSYSVIDQFIQQTDINTIEHGHRNLLFLTPQKAQISIDSSLVENADNKGIKILSFLAQGDMSNIEFKNWITGKVSKELFLQWINALKKDDMLNSFIYKFEKTVRDAEYYNREITLAKNRKDSESINEYESLQKNNQYKLTLSLIKLTEAILQEQKAGKYISTKERFNKANTHKKAKILAEIIDFVLPFERAKISPCILLATSDKFDYNVNIVVNDKDGNPIIKSLPFDYIIGQKKKSDSSGEENKTADVNGKPFSEQIEFLKNNYFVIDENNYFRTKNIAFTVIVDEEHIAYNKFFNSAKTTLIEQNTKIAHVFSVVHRIFEYIKDATEENKNDYVLYNDHKKFVNELTDLFNKCETSKGVTLDKIINLFSNSLLDIVIDNSDLEQIINICKNIFSITPKRYFNEMALQKIRIGSYKNNTECKIYFNRETIDTNPTLHDIVQTLMCVLAACSHIKDGDFKKMISAGADESQNSLLAKFINKARANHINIDALFDRVNNEDLYIDEFFTYFTPKIVFSIEKIKDLSFNDEKLNNNVYVTFKLELFEALPEVTLMRVLHNTNNAVICLSATSGFKNSFNGNYCRPVMERYGNDIENNLNYYSITRVQSDTEKLQQLRECRAKARPNLSINEFYDTENNHITATYNNSKFSACFKRWNDELSPSINRIIGHNNPYRKKEIKRQIEAMLLAAFDKKNSLILSLSNDFGSIIRDYVKSDNVKKDKNVAIIDKDNHKIIEIKPFDNGITLRIILFNAKMVKDLNIDKYLELENQNTKIAFISAYKSAGTGLNLFTRYKYKDGDVDKNFDEDFERLILINSPFYTDILKKEEGINSIENYVLLLKHYASGHIKRQLKEFDVNLIDGNNYKILMKEHEMSILKDIMQAVGRVERRDTYIDTEIFLPSDVADDLAIQFSQLEKENNELIFQSMSLLNYELKNYCLNKAVERSFKNDNERDDFSAKTTREGNDIENFFNNYLTSRLNTARQKNDKNAVKLNETLRSIDCIKNPQHYISNLLKIPEIRDDAYLQGIIKSFYLHTDISKNITLCTKVINIKTILTDLTNGDRIYKPYESILPKYHEAIKNKDGTANKILKPIFNLDFEEKLSKDRLPHPAMLPLFKGNLGEYMFKESLKIIHVVPLTTDEVFDKLESTVYELFDFYVLIENKLFCIDVKNWSLSFDKKDLSLETKEKALKKRETVMEIASRKNLNAEFIYVNTHQDKNAINTKQEFYNNGNIYYMNLFKMTNQYELSDKTKKFIPKDRLNINSNLIHLLGGNLNG